MQLLPPLYSNVKILAFTANISLAAFVIFTDARALRVLGKHTPSKLIVAPYS
jgi:hypothetical protein